MTLKDFYPFTKALSGWCLEQPSLTRFTLGIDSITNSLVVSLEWQYGQKICRIDHMFTHLIIKSVCDERSLVSLIEWKYNKARDESYDQIHGV